MPHAQGKCIIGAKAQKVPKVPERTDLYWDGDSKERSQVTGASTALPYFR
jgi:hypothetical protein